ncbi:hypothetical protein [Citrobacter koseri]|nr:hypothetical protein [Citrobacter koseri]
MNDELQKPDGAALIRPTSLLPQSGIEAPDGDAGASYQAYNSN